MEFILKYKKQFIIGGVLSLFLIISSIVYYTMSDNDKSNKDIIAKTKVTLKEKKSTTDEKEEVKEYEQVVSVEYYVDIKGAITNPGVYRLTSNSIVNDVITLAGGITKEGDTTCINLSKKITDEMVIYVYTKEETKELRKKDEEVDTSENLVCNNIVNEPYIDPNESNITNNSTTDNTVTNDSKITNNTEIKTEINSDKVNINTADIDVLSTLPNIGESKAKAIIEYRNSNGNFTTIEAIKEVKGIGESIFLKIKDLITV